MRGLITIAAVVGFSSLFVSKAQALTTAFVDFETNPSLATGPSDFDETSGTQTIVVPGVATFTGGVVLGNEANLPALSFGTAPNVYATAITNPTTGLTAPASLLATITIAIDPSYAVEEVSFPLFNGRTAVESYSATAFNGTTQIGQQLLSDLPANISGGYGVIDLKTTSDITSVTITTTSDAFFDFSIDSVAFNEPVSSAITPGGVPIPPQTNGGGGPTAVPLPAAAGPAVAMLAGLGLIALVRSRRKNAAV